MTEIHKCSMRKSELVALAAAGVIAGCSFYDYEKRQPPKIQQTTSAIQPIASPSFDVYAIGEAPDFTSIENVTAKKRAFFDYLRP